MDNSDNFYILKELPESSRENVPNLLVPSCDEHAEIVETPCLLCDDTFNLNEGLTLFAAHLFEVHSVVVEDIQNIFYLAEYIGFWKDRFKSRPMEEIIPSINFDSTGRKYYFLSALIKDDKKLRHQLRLDYALKVKEFERTDDKYMKSCLYCNSQIEGKRQDMIDHLSSKHNLHLGNPHNLVFIEELIDKIEKKFNDLECLYCDKKFPERHILKEHMRKKLHKRINPENKEYDKYFMMNYLEEGKDWHAIKKESDKLAISLDPNSDEEYSDWNDGVDQVTCLFCEQKEIGIDKICNHMKSSHSFDFEEVTKSFSFFQKIQMINYIRRQMVDIKCFYCGELFERLHDLKRHMGDEEHFKVPDLEIFDQSEFLFPTCEEDALLYLVEDSDENE